MKKAREHVSFSGRRSCAILLVGGLIIGIAAYEAVQPLRRHIADRYLAKGDGQFASLQFDKAADSYEAALRYNPGLENAKQREELAEAAPTEIVPARALLLQLGASDYVAKIDQATKDYATAPEAYLVGVTFFQEGDYRLARYALERATSLDVRYPDGWHYLYLTYEKLAADNETYRAKAEAAKAKRDDLSARWR